MNTHSLFSTFIATLVSGALLYGSCAQAAAQDSLDHQLDKAFNNFQQTKNVESIREMESLEAKLIERSGRHSKDHIGLLSDVALMYMESGHYDLASTKFDELLNILKNGFPAEPRTIASYEFFLGLCRQLKGDVVASETALNGCLATLTKAGAKTAIEYARAETVLGTTLGMMGKYTRAHAAHEDALSICAELGLQQSVVAASIYNNIGLLYRLQGDYQRSTEFYEKAIAVYRSLPDDHSLDIGRTLSNLGFVLLKRNELARSEECFQQALRLVSAARGADHPDVATVLLRYGQLLHARGQYKLEERVLLQCIEILRQKLGHSSLTAWPLANLGENLVSRGDFDNGEKCLRAAIAILTISFGELYSELSTIHEALGITYLQQGNIPSALIELEASQVIALDHSLQTIPTLVTADQEVFYAWGDRRFNRSLGSILEFKDDPAVAEKSAEWRLNSKAVMQEARASLRHQLHQDSDDDLLADVRKLDQLRQTVSEQMVRRSKLDSDIDIRNVQLQLENHERLMCQRLAAQGRTYLAQRWVTLDAIRGVLEKDSVLIDFARIAPFQPFNRTTEEQRGERYIAWVIPAQGEGDVKCIDLGASREIDELIAHISTTIQSAAEKPLDDELGATQQINIQLHDLADRIYQPLVAHRSVPPKHLIIVPDGDLWQVPWAALVIDDDGRYLVEQSSIQYLNAGRDLMNTRSVDVDPGYPVIFGNPDYYSPDETSLQPADNGKDVNRGNAPRLNKHAPKLPQSEIEVRKVIPKIEWIAAKPAKVFVESMATEESFKKVVNNPPILFMSVHGYFLKQLPSDTTTPSSDKRTADDDINDPLNRCGLLLWEYGREAVGMAEDGVVTGTEIASLNLAGTRLVILSACQTGAGDFHQGLGLVGLRHAFQLAGAQAVLATLWSVRDVESATMTTMILDSLKNRVELPVALQAAQVEIISRRRAQIGCAHPWLWAGFTVTGH